MQKPLISVIVPVYNAEKYLHRCMDSILNQTYKNLEIILIDDGSKDSSGTICDAYAAKDSRIKVIHQENSGVSAARNAGLDAAFGDYITFVDSDDYIELNLFDSCIAAIELYKPDLIDWGINFVDCDGNLCRKEIHTQPKNKLLDRSYINTELIPQLIHVERTNPDGMKPWVWNKLYLRSVIDSHNIRFHQEIHLWEDGVFTIEFMRYIESVYFLDEAYYNYRNVPDSLSKQHDERIFHSIDLIYNKYMQLYQSDYDFNSLASKEYRFYLIHGTIIRELEIVHTCADHATRKSVNCVIKSALSNPAIYMCLCKYRHRNPFFALLKITLKCGLTSLALYEYHLYYNIQKKFKHVRR